MTDWKAEYERLAEAAQTIIDDLQTAVDEGSTVERLRTMVGILGRCIERALPPPAESQIRCRICGRLWSDTPGTGHCTAQHGTCPLCQLPRTCGSCRCLTSSVQAASAAERELAPHHNFEQWAADVRRRIIASDPDPNVRLQTMTEEQLMEAADLTPDAAERAAEKQRSRDADAAALASGEKTREQLREENSHFREIAKEPIQWDRMKADAAEREHCLNVAAEISAISRGYGNGTKCSVDCILEARADAARVATERAEKAAQERIANVHDAAPEQKRCVICKNPATCLAVEPPRHDSRLFDPPTGTERWDRLAIDWLVNSEPSGDMRNLSALLQLTASKAQQLGFDRGVREERARCLAVEPDDIHIVEADDLLTDWRELIASGEPAK